VRPCQVPLKKKGRKRGEKKEAGYSSSLNQQGGEVLFVCPYGGKREG